jgi:hypothetical protein
VSYRFPCESKSGYLEDEDEERAKAPEVEDRYKPKVVYPPVQYDGMEVVSARLAWYKLKLRKLV